MCLVNVAEGLGSGAFCGTIFYMDTFLVWEEPYSYYLAGSCSSLPSAGPG